MGKTHLENEKKVLKAGIGYTIGNILIKGINFLLVPLFSRIMTTQEFGVYNVFLSYDSILFVVVGLALHSSVKSAKYEFHDIDKYVSSITLVYFLNALILCFLGTVFRIQLVNWSGFPFSIILLLIIFSTCQALMTLYNERVSLDYAYKKYTALSVVNSATNVSISLLLMFTVFRNHKDYGRIIGATCAGIIVASYIIFSFYKSERPKYNKKFWKFGIKYSAPIVPHGISQVLLSQFDRIMIQRIVSSSAAGIYSLAANVKLILTVITTSISTAWSTWFFEMMEEKKIESLQLRAKQIVSVYVIFTSLLLLGAPEIIYVIGGSKYEAGKFVAIPMIFDAFILFLYNIIIPSEYYKKKTNYIMMGTLFAAIINVVTNYIFIKRYGFIAAAYTTLFSYACYLILHIIISKRVVGFYVIPLKFMILIVVLLAIFASIILIFLDNILLRYCVGLPIVFIAAFFVFRYVKNDLLHI